MTGLLLALLAAAVPILLVRGYLMSRDPGAVAGEGGPLLAPAESRGRLSERVEASLATSIGANLTRRVSPVVVQWLNRRLDITGRPKGETVEQFMGTQVVWFGAGVFIGVASRAVIGNLVFSLLMLVVLTITPVLLLVVRGRKRQARIERELPEFMDVLAVVMRAGMSYRSALWRVTDELTGPVSQELRVALGQMELGANRRDAFRRVSQRNSAPGLQRFIVAQTQAEELGVPLAEAINTLANEMRRRYDQALRRWATRQASIIDLVNVSFMVLGCIVIVLVTMLYAGGVLGEGGVFDQFQGSGGLEGALGG